MIQRETFYLFFNNSNGEILSPSNRVIDTAPSLDEAARMFPDATFRIVNSRKEIH